MKPETMLAIVDSDVNRWHASRSPRLRASGDTIRLHHSRCLAMLECLWPDAPQSLRDAVKYHDLPEVILGDPPYPTKRAFPKLAAAYAEAEAEVIARYSIPQPKDATEALWVKLVDRIDAYWWVRWKDPDELRTPDWQEARAEIGGLAQSLGIGAKVEQVLSEVDA